MYFFPSRFKLSSVVVAVDLLSITECVDCSNHTTRLLARSIDLSDVMGAVLGSILPLRLVVTAVFHVVWCQLSALSSSLVAHIPSMRAALPWWRRHDPNTDVLYWNVRVQLLRDPCPPYYHRWMSPTTSLSCLFCVSDGDEARMHGMVEVTLVRGSEEMLEDPASTSWRVD